MSDNSHHEGAVTAIMDLMTIEEMIALLAGLNMWETTPIPRLGVPSLKTTDGPAGVRGSKWFGGSKSTFIPCGVSCGATFDPDLLRKLGTILGKETKAKSSHILLAPTINMSRSPFGGRNFESFGEDPCLTGEMGANIVDGIQSESVGACVKHFVANEQESRRFNIDEKINQRALHEVYLQPFRRTMSVRPWCVMSSYNKVNGEHVDVSRELMNNVLRGQWGFDGMTMSDWGGTNSTVESVAAGLDLEMPGPPVARGEKLLAAFKAGKVSKRNIETSARNIVNTIAKAGLLTSLPCIVTDKMKILGHKELKISQTNSSKEDSSEKDLDLPEHREIVRESATGSIVLLKNNGILPLQSLKLRKLAIIGPNAMTPTAGGSGSAALNPYYTTTPLGSIVQQAKEANPELDITFSQGALSHRLLPLLKNITIPDGSRKGMKLEFFRGYDLQGEVVDSKSWDSSMVFFLSDGDLPSSLRGKQHSMRLSCSFKPELSGQYQFGLSSIGQSKLYINDEPLIDNTGWTKPGGILMNCGSEEFIGTIYLDQSKSYEVRIDHSATRPPFKPHDNTLFPTLVGIRVGALPPVDEQALFDDAVSKAEEADAVVFIGGLNNDWEKEGTDRWTLSLPRRLPELMSAIIAANSKTVIVNQSACAVDLGPFKSTASAIVQAWYQGQENGNALADVLLGRANPSGKLPLTFPKRIEDHGSSQSFPGDLENDQVEYKEGVFIGYRWFDKHNIDPLWEFGFGLSYTTFDFSNVKVVGHISSKSMASLRVDISNTGKVYGAEVIQVYMSQSSKIPESERVVKSLKAFKKIGLEPGQTSTISIQLGFPAVEWYDEQLKSWMVDPGEYKAFIGCSSRDIKAQVLVRVEE